MSCAVFVVRGEDKSPLRRIVKNTHNKNSHSKNSHSKNSHSKNSHSKNSHSKNSHNLPKAVILSAALRRSIAQQKPYCAESKDLGDARWQMLFGAF
jgi:hypothetical protein